VKRMSVYSTQSPNVRTEAVPFTENGVSYVRRIVRTPVGELFTIERPAGFTTWHIKKLFQKPEDYKALMFMVKDQRVEPNYEPYAKAEREFGEDAIFRAALGATPLHEIMISWMGVETFAVEWAERRDEIEKLYQAMVEKRREVYPIVAQSPALHSNYGGNETGSVMGRERFEKYVLPNYLEAAEVMHQHGKFVGAHLDGLNKVWAEIVAKSNLDYVEAFTPAPDSDMSMADAFRAWPGKLLWIHFPSSVQLARHEVIAETARQIIRASAPDHRLVIGITENIPEDRWQQNLLTISRVINEEGVYPLR